MKFDAVKKIKIAPSLLSADILNLEDEIISLQKAGADWLHVDVMDGHYVPPITFGTNLVSALRKRTSLPIDVHLMITPSQPHITAFAEAGASFITIHPEADHHPHRILQQIRSLGVKAGVALNPSTPLSILDYLMPHVDMILIMTVNPGFGGQSFIEDLLTKISQVRHKIEESGFPILLEVDGGVNLKTAPNIIHAGTDVLVSGTAIFDYYQTKKSDFNKVDAYKQIINSLRQGGIA